MKTKRIVAVGAALTMSLGLGVTVAVDQATAAPRAAVAESSAKYPVLREGARGDEVRILQYLLRANGVHVAATGNFRAKTKQAVRDFQAQKGLKADAVVGPDTWAKMLFVVREGNRGDAVKALQVGLKAQGYPLKVNGSFGPGTRAAVKKFQDERDLDGDGVAGPNTWGALLGVEAAAEPPVDNGSTRSPGPDPRFPNPKTTYGNGQVPASQLCQVPGSKSPAYKMSCRAIPDFMAMNNAYRAEFGRNLQVDHLGAATTYRTVPVQQALYRKYGSPRASEPGTSNHGWGLALDINMFGGGGSHNSATYRWLNENGPAYGFDDTVSHEDWHWQYQR